MNKYQGENASATCPSPSKMFVPPLDYPFSGSRGALKQGPTVLNFTYTHTSLQESKLTHVYRSATEVLHHVVRSYPTLHH